MTFAQQHALEPVEGALAALGWVEGEKGAVVRCSLQQRQQSGERLLERLVERQHLPRDLGPGRARVVAVVHMAIPPPQVNDREVRGGFAIRHRGALEHAPALGVVRVRKFIDQARFLHPGLAHQCHHLTMPSSGLCQGLVQGVELALPSDKARQPLGGPGLEALAYCRGPNQLTHLHRLCQPFHREGAQGVDAHQAFHQPYSRGGQTDCPRHGQLLHARRQVHRLPNGRVVQV